ncbi:uncharacterized protein LOC132059536 [Lycium ferocissimum]|uniref:uncharacterized protein LOC132059536 n=1 Tax=Lycium ferocissimum TaxID=112874 RepID=UPI0028163546|nr:uncharacterized protein LOC132059536 [Lycium ferocissimum]
MSSKIKKWNVGKLFMCNGAGCSGCSKPNLANILEQNPKPKIPIDIKPSPSICHTSSSCEINGVHSMDDFYQDDQTSTTISINIGSSPPPSSEQNDDINLSQSETNSEFKVRTCPKIGGNHAIVKNLDDPFQDNQTSTPFSIINIDSLSPPSIDEKYDTNLSQSKTTSGSRVSTCPNIGGTLDIVKNLDDPLFQDNHTSTTFSINTESLSPPSSDQNKHTNMLQSKANSEFRAGSCPKFSSTLAVVINSDDPVQDFKKSMLQMIFEKEIYSPEDMKDLLNCFLQLNSPSNHYIIIQAFMEILNNRMVVSKGPEKEK